MPRIIAIASILAVALLSAAATSVQAQSLQPSSPYAPPPPMPAAPTSNAAQPAVISSDPGQRAATTSPIQSSGPSRPTPMTNAAGIPSGTTAMPVQTVRDARGQVVPGAVQVAPNRAYDPATGGYIQTTPPAPPAR